MRKLLLRIFPLSFLVAILFAGFFASHVFASAKHATSHLASSYSLTFVECNLSSYTGGDPITTNTGNECTNDDPGFVYEPLSTNRNTVGRWIGWGGFGYLGTCKVDAWFPWGNLSSDTQTRYDFWHGVAGGGSWLGWPGHNINQYAAPAGWYTLAKSLPINSSDGLIQVTAHDAGGSGNLAFAAMRFICTQP